MSINSPLRERIFSYSLSLSFSLSISCGTTRRVKFLFLPKFPRFVRREFFNGRTDGIFVFELSGAGKPRERCSRAYYPPTLERTPFVFHPLSPGPSPNLLYSPRSPLALRSAPLNLIEERWRCPRDSISANPSWMLSNIFLKQSSTKLDLQANVRRGINIIAPAIILFFHPLRSRQ